MERNRITENMSKKRHKHMSKKRHKQKRKLIAKICARKKSNRKKSEDDFLKGKIIPRQILEAVDV